MSNHSTDTADETLDETASAGQTAANTDPENVQQDPVPDAKDLRAKVESLEGELAAVRQERDQEREKALRAAAEADNVRKRADRDLENAHKYALERFVNELLPVKDSLELGLAAATDSVAVENLREGTEMTLRMLSAAVEKFGVREVNPIGDPFDPEVHQAMSARESTECAAGTVLEVIQKGYLLNERLVRPALVIVAKEPE